MANVLTYLIKSFLLIRDFFGYLLPGVVFAALLAPSESWDFLFTTPGWFTLAALLAGCYIAGQILVAAGYGLHGIIGRIVARMTKRAPANAQAGHNPQPDRDARDTQTMANAFYYRTLYPDMFIEPDRQDTMHMMRLGAAIALIFTAVLHLAQGELSWDFLPLAWVVCLAAGLFMFLNSYLHQHHLALTKEAAVIAATRAATEKAARKAAAAVAAERLAAINGAHPPHA